MNSREFRSRLAKAARLTARTGHEGAFSYLLDIRSQCRHWTPVFEGCCDRTDRYAFLEWKDRAGLDASLGICAHLLDLHLHPDSSGPLNLSYVDVCEVDQDSVAFPVRPLVAVGTVSEQGRIDLLLLQKTVNASLQYQCRNVLQQAYQQHERVEELWPSHEVARATTVPGFIRAGIVTYEVSRRGPSIALLVDELDLTRFR